MTGSNLEGANRANLRGGIVGGVAMNGG